LDQEGDLLRRVAGRVGGDALQQILVHLLQNAGDTSPQEGEIALSAQVEVKENEPVFVLIQVTDSGRYPCR
jgi:signal transduction histidine kinase